MVIHLEPSLKPYADSQSIKEASTPLKRIATTEILVQIQFVSGRKAANP